MIRWHYFLFVLVAVVVAGCGTQSIHRIGYETLLNVGNTQCQRESAEECSAQRKSYDDYQKERNGLLIRQSGQASMQ